MGLMDGRAGLVTGGASGIGRAGAIAFGAEGGDVVVADLASAREAGEETVRLVRESGGQARFVPCDVSVASDCRRLVEETVSVYGSLDFAFNNAGIAAFATIPDTNESVFDAVLAVNLKGVWLGLKYQIPQMVAQGGGAIVNTASVAGLLGGSNAGAYVASKHGVVGLTKTAALEWAPQGVRVNAICPGLTRSGLTADLDSGARDAILQNQAMQREADPHEIAAAVVWLCSEKASFVTGIAMPVDGGTVATRAFVSGAEPQPA
jgi:NAD(P)-dependent dehydrogenase (short-subunit alcohol dehydrogenase family)